MGKRRLELAGVQVTRAQITALLGLAVVTWGAWLIFAGTSVGLEHLKPFSLAVGVLAGAVAAFNAILWRWPVFRSLLADRPILLGAWKIEIASTFIDQVTGQPKVIDAYYQVRQTYLNISIRLITKETTSKTQCAQLLKSEDGEWTLQGTFLDTPDVSLRHQSGIHFGAFWIILAGNPVTSFRGQYWTDRGTKGKIKSIAHLPDEEIADYESAVKRFSDLSLLN